VFVTGVLAQVDEMLDREEHERCCHALNKELGTIEDDIRFESTRCQQYSFVVFSTFVSKSWLYQYSV